ncbi:MAG: transposase [Deltaproteobacteria bacterium]|nr:transposase [Deltaproteobacteria bacterium]
MELQSLISTASLLRVYGAALDVHRAELFGRCEHRSGIASFDRLVEDVMGQTPYAKARRVFWIVDNGSSHRGPRSVERLQSRYTNLVLVHAPVHASWLNQIEIYLSILQRKALTPNDFKSLETLRDRIWNRPPKWDYLPTGKLSIGVEAWALYDIRKRWSDTKNRVIEDILNEFIIGVIRAADILRKRSREGGMKNA